MGQAGLRRAILILAALAGVLLVEAPAMARQRMSFAPGHHGGYAASQRRTWRPTWQKRYRASPGRRSRATPAGPSNGAPPGFKMEDGVLTYPAPERFQPKNLKHL